MRSSARLSVGDAVASGEVGFRFVEDILVRDGVEGWRRGEEVSWR